jgi:hypothetical protein
MSNPDVATSLGSELSSSVPPDVEVLSAADSSPPSPEVVVTDVEVLSAADSSPPSPEVVVTDVEVLSAADSSSPSPEVVVTDVEVLSAADSSSPSPEVVVSLSAGSGVERSEPPPHAEASSSVRRTAENCLIR